MARDVARAAAYPTGEEVAESFYSEPRFRRLNKRDLDALRSGQRHAAPPKSYAAVRGAADPYAQPQPPVGDVHAEMVAAARELERTLVRVKVQANRPRRRTVTQGRSRERRRGPCRSSGSRRRASTRSSSRGGDSGDSDSDEPPGGRHQHLLDHPGARGRR